MSKIKDNLIDSLEMDYWSLNRDLIGLKKQLMFADYSEVDDINNDILDVYANMGRIRKALEELRG